ncbi:tetratricopeptide repeat protein [Fusobacterium sp. PH5-44]|uniref:tetratricopeptide repeat protein n=1 Tax=unclassified Fusobacterium TaxID=2648384 RepID=UPI003D1C2604
MLKENILKQYIGKDLPKEEEEIRLQLIADPYNSSIVRDLIVILCRKKDIAGAIKLCIKQLVKKPKDSEFLGILGYLCYEIDKTNKAIKYYKKSLDIEPGAAFVHFLLGNAYSRVGRVKEAVQSYDMAICLDFDIYSAHIHFAQNYEAIGHHTRALQEYIIAYEIDPRDEKLRDKIQEMSKKTKNNV